MDMKPVELFVAVDGDDAWEGTRERPFATLARAQRAVRALTPGMAADVVVNLRAGRHELAAPLELSAEHGDSGRDGHRVIYQAYGYGTSAQEEAVVSGGRAVTGWVLDDPVAGVWRASVGALETRQLFVDGRRARRAALDHGLPGTVTMTETGYLTDSDVPLAWSGVEDVELVYRGALAWTEPRLRVAAIAAGASGSTEIVMAQPGFRRARAVYAKAAEWGNPDPLVPTSIEGSRSFLTDPGEFHLDRSRPGDHVLFYIPRPGEDLARATAIAPALELLVRGAGAPGAPLRDVALRGLTFAHATWLQPSSPDGFVHWYGNYFENGDPIDPPARFSDAYASIPAHVAFACADRVAIEGNRFERLGGCALELAGSDCVIRGNVIHDVSGGGIVVGSDRPMLEPAVASERVVVESNWIHDVGVEFPGSVGIAAVETTDVRIAHNQVNAVPYTGIVNLGPYLREDARTRGARIVGNRIFDAMRVLRDGGGIYVNSPQGTSYEDGTVIGGNVVHGLRNEYNVGIYTDLGTTWTTVEHNVVFDTQHSAGGCSLPGGFQIAHVRLRRNWWTHAEPHWGCGQPLDVAAEDNTVLPPEGAEAACRADADCAAILAGAGLEPAYRHLLGGVGGGA